jgi:tetratricopeptide (TPR) repeat protein
VPHLNTLLERFPELREHSVAPPALRPFAGIEQAEREISAACTPGASASVFALLGNIMVREGRYVDALEAYRSAADLDPSDALASWACAEIAHVLADEHTSRTYRARALALRRVYPDPLPVGARTPILLLLRDAPYAENTPLELLLDRSRFAVHKYYVEGDAIPQLPPYALTFCAFGCAESAGEALRRASDFIAHAPAAINDPARLGRVAREALAGTLGAIGGVRSAHANIVESADAARTAVPALLRPIDTHRGDGFAYVANDDELRLHLARFPAARYYRSDFVDTRGPDGRYRKFRAIFVDGVAFPYHLAIAPQWMVHYQSSPMRESAALREEERAFLEDPTRLFPSWPTVMPQIARAVGLDYFGIDATVFPDGRLFVFEADAAMLVHDEDPRDVFAYKRPHVARIRDALHAAIANRIRLKRR